MDGDDVNWGDSTPPETYTVAAQGAISRNHTYDDNGTYTVTYTVTDKDGGVSTPASTFLVTVINVAPTATLANDGPINEGSPVNVRFSDQLDPSDADTSAGFHYAFSCTNGRPVRATYAGSGTSRLDDLRVRRQRDAHGQGPDHRQGRRLHRVHDRRHGQQRRPDGDLGNNGPVNEGSPATVTLQRPVRPVRAPTRRPASTTRSPATTASSGRDLRRQRHERLDHVHLQRQRDLHGPGADHRQGRRVHRVHDVVTVNNVVPTVTAPANQSSDEGENKSFSLGSFSDPGTADNPWTVNVNWGD